MNVYLYEIYNQAAICFHSLGNHENALTLFFKAFNNADDEIAKSVKLGVNKINISSDIKDAFYQECRKVLQDQAIREPMFIYPKCIEAMNEVIRHKINLFDDADKVKFYK